ncbi:MAG: glycosyltransferase family 4 protein [Candidatus Diapherotrites archaeon]|nr:glycosyltransferase family 4 protein [Candidatus Diapherotrites archaeon]
MKIFFITHTYSLRGVGGGEAFCNDFLRELAGRGHKICVFTTKTDDFSREEKELGIEVHHAPSFGHHAFHKFEYLLYAGMAEKAAARFQPDIIHAQNDAFPALIGSRVKERVKKPLVASVEYLSDKSVSLNLKIVFWFNRFFLPRINFDKLVSWSKFVVENYLVPWGIPKKKIVLIPGAVDVSQYLKSAKPHPKLKKFGSNLIVSAKPLHTTNAMGIEQTIRAMKIVSAKYPVWKFVIVGAGEKGAWLEGLVKKLGLENNVVFAGLIPASEIPSVYAAADIVVHSFAFKATTSIALIESMAAQKAIVATDFGEVANTVGNTAVLAKPNNPESIARGIIRLIENPALRKDLGAKARKRAVEKFSIKAIVDEFENLYCELAKK